jgi:hypothetical protein
MRRMPIRPPRRNKEARKSPQAESRNRNGAIPGRKVKNKRGEPAPAVPAAVKMSKRRNMKEPDQNQLTKVAHDASCGSIAWLGHRGPWTLRSPAIDDGPASAFATTFDSSGIRPHLLQPLPPTPIPAPESTTDSSCTAYLSTRRVRGWRFCPPTSGDCSSPFIPSCTSQYPSRHELRAKG